jgi:hypothetical protein
MTRIPHRSARAAVIAPAGTMTRLTAGLVALVALLLLVAGAARAQEEFPRIGLSASRDVYLDHITVDMGATFTLYAMAFGHTPGQPLGETVLSLPWVIHQVCCGAVLDLQDMELNPDLIHDGHPLAGMVTSSEQCLDQDSIWLATLTVRVAAELPGDYLWAAGPYGPVENCEGTNPFFMAMPVTITFEGEPTPTTDHAWGAIKSLYR